MKSRNAECMERMGEFAPAPQDEREPSLLLTFSLAFIDGWIQDEREEVKRHWQRVRAHVDGAQCRAAPERECGKGAVPAIAQGAEGGE